MPSPSSAHQSLNAIIEISARSLPVKYEFDKSCNRLTVDRFVQTSMMYPCNYGYIPDTLGEDSDPLDVLVVSPYPIAPGAGIQVRVIGMLAMTDDGGVDHKLLAVPVSKLTPLYDDVVSYKDMPSSLLSEIEHFFAHYKDLEEGKWAKIDGWESQDVAQSFVKKAFERAAEL